jgi:hypothetical protein
MSARLVLATGFAFAELDSRYAGAASADSTDSTDNRPPVRFHDDERFS